MKKNIAAAAANIANIKTTLTPIDVKRAIEGIIDAHEAARDEGKSREQLAAEIIGGFLFRAIEEGNGVLYYDPAADQLTNENNPRAFALPFSWRFEWCQSWDYDWYWSRDTVVPLLVEAALVEIDQICRYYWARH